MNYNKKENPEKPMVTFGHLMQHFKESKEKIKIQSHPVPINIIV